MPNICCSPKLYMEMGIQPEIKVPDKQDDKSLLGDWYVNIFEFNRKNHLIFINQRTSFAFFFFHIKRGLLKKFDSIFIDGLGNALALEGIPEYKIKTVCEEYNTFTFARSKDTVTTGIMNDYARMCKVILDYDNVPFHEYDQALVKGVNETPLLKKDYFNAVQEMKRILA